MAEQKLPAEEVFRQGLQAVVEVARKLSPYCQTVDEMVGMVELALENDAQLKILLKLTLDKK